MQQFKLKVTSRQDTGRGVARRLRAAGDIPACVYSKGHSRSISLSAVDFRDLRRATSGTASLVELVDETGETVLTHIQEIQRNSVKSGINHIDFHEVARGESFAAQVPVHLVSEAEAIGVRNEGGLIDHKVHQLDIRCIPSKFPDHIEIDVKDLAVGQAIHISDLAVLDGVEYLGDPIQVIVSCQSPTVAVVTAAGSEEIAADEVPASKVKDDSAAGGS